MAASRSASRLGFAKSLAVICVLTIGVIGFFAIGNLFGIKSLFAGFLFSLYWGGIMESKSVEFGPALGGALGGLFNAWLLHFLPQKMGDAGFAIAIATILVAIYAQINGRVPQIFNLAFMLFLTVATIPAVASEADFLGMGEAVLLAAVYVGTLTFLMGRLTRSKTPANSSS